MARLLMIVSVIIIILTGCGTIDSTVQKQLEYGQIIMPSVMVDLIRLDFEYNDDELISFFEEDLFYVDDESTYARIKSNGTAIINFSEQGHRELLAEINEEVRNLDNYYDIEKRGNNGLLVTGDSYDLDEEERLEIITLYFFHDMMNGRDVEKEKRSFVFVDEYDEVIDKWRFPQEFDDYYYDVQRVIIGY